MTNGIVILGEDKTIEAKAKSAKIPTLTGDYKELPFDKTLFVTPGTTVPWDLLPAAWHFLDRWDAAVPLWRYGVLAQDVGSESERQRTADIVRDLRVLLYSHELLFVRNNEAGQALMDAFNTELADSDETRLAFLRAFYQVKPKLCVLPITWLAEVVGRSKQSLHAIGSQKRKRTPGESLVSVEVSPGRFVKCYPGDEQKVKAQYQKRRGRGK